MDEHIDKVFDMLLITTTAISFLSAIFFIGKAIIDTINGWYPVTGQLYNAALSVVIGMVVGVYFVYIKSMGGDE